MEESSLQNTKEFVEMLYQKWYELTEPTREKIGLRNKRKPRFHRNARAGSGMVMDNLISSALGLGKKRQHHSCTKWC